MKYINIFIFICIHIVVVYIYNINGRIDVQREQEWSEMKNLLLPYEMKNELRELEVIK